MATRITSWITRPTTNRAVPNPTANLDEVLEAILNPSQLLSLSATAVKVAGVSTQPDCLPSALGALIASDPSFSAALLRTVNSARNGPGRAVSSVERAVLVVGLNKVRALALSLSLPPIHPLNRNHPAALEHSRSSISGAIIARELAVRRGYPAPDDDLHAALLRDIGVLLIQQTYPAAWAELSARTSDPLGADACARERNVFGTDHAEVGAEVLRRWGLHDDMVEPIRYHHHPERLAGTPHAVRAELLWFAGLLTRLEFVIEHPAALDFILFTAAKQFSLSAGALVDFLDVVRPKISAFAETLDREIGLCPDYASLLTTASAELSRLSVGARQ